MANIEYSSVGENPFRRLLGHNPKILEAFEGVDMTINSGLSLSDDIREEVRRVLAKGQGSQY